MAKQDVRLQFEGSMVLFHLLTRRAHSWVRDNVDTDNVSFFGQALAVESRYVDTLVEGMRETGLIIR